MSTWNHRVWTDSSKEEKAFTVKETYYNGAGEICGCTEGPVDAYGHTLEQLSESIQQIQRAVQKVLDGDFPVLDEDGFVFGEWK